MSKQPGMFPVTGYSAGGPDTTMWFEDWRCGHSPPWVGNAELLLPSWGLLELPILPREVGRLEICERCPNQLSCLSGHPNKLTNEIVRGLEPGREYW